MKALSFDDISLVPRYNNIASRRNVDTSVNFGGIHCSTPIFSSNMDTITGSDMAREMFRLGGLGFLHRFCSIEENVQLYRDSVFIQHNTRERKMSQCSEAVVSIGVNEGLDRFYALYESGARHFCIDIAHGHSDAVGSIIDQIKAARPDAFIVAGNVCTASGAEFLVDHGADAIKVGIGPGSVCSTRIKTGFGVPQFTAIRDCRRVNCFLIADGGIRTPGDAVKALYAGADAIMVGGMLAGCDETPGETQYEAIVGLEGVKTTGHKVFRGMASKEAQDDFMGQMTDWKTAEGISIKVSAKGPAANVVSDIMGGIRSGMTYCGANKLSQIRQRADHVEISAAGMAEGRPHGKERLL